MEAADDFLHGLSHSHVVAKFGVSRTTASRWHRALTAKRAGVATEGEGNRKAKPTHVRAEGANHGCV